MYRITFTAKLKTPATTSSILGGTNGLQIIYTDVNDSVVVTTGTVANTSGTSLSINTTQSIYTATIAVMAKASTNIQYKFDYACVGATPMAYGVDIRVEKI